MSCQPRSMSVASAQMISQRSNICFGLLMDGMIGIRRYAKRHEYQYPAIVQSDVIHRLIAPPTGKPPTHKTLHDFISVWVGRVHLAILRHASAAFVLLSCGSASRQFVSRVACSCLAACALIFSSTKLFTA